MKILITGAGGLLGQKLLELLGSRKDHDILATARGLEPPGAAASFSYQKMDICEAEDISRVIFAYGPDAVIHTAAATQVDWCESNREAAWKTNAKAVDNLAIICKRQNCHLVHLSTDFIFDGENGPYREEDAPRPLSYYGETKLEAEKYVQQSPAPWTIIRTILVYGVLPRMSRSNVVLWVKDSLEKGKKIKVVTDQFRTPTLADDLAAACVAAAERKAYGVYHVSGPDLMSIFDLALRVARFFGLDESLIEPALSADIGAPAKRPPKTGFVLDKARKTLNYSPRSFVQGLEVVKNQLAALRPNPL